MKKNKNSVMNPKSYTKMIKINNLKIINKIIQLINLMIKFNFVNRVSKKIINNLNKAKTNRHDKEQNVV